jgi:predicted Zn-dependent protease
MKSDVRMTRMILPAAACWAVMIGCSGSPLGYVEKGNALMASGKYVDASLNYKKAIQKDAKFAEAYYRLGLSELKQDKIREGLAALSQASRLSPDRKDISVSLADTSLAAYVGGGGRSTHLYEQVKTISDDLLKKDSASYDGLRLQGQLATLDGKPDQAVELFRKANVVKPLQRETTLALAAALIKNKQEAEAETFARTLIQYDKTDGAAYDLLYGLYQSGKRVAEAEEIIKEKVNNNPKEAQYRVQLAAHYIGRKKTAEAESTLRQLLDDPKTFPQARLQVGDFYSNLGDAARALAYYEEGAKTSSPADKLLYEKRKVGVLIAQNKRDEAMRSAEAILKEHPQDEEVIRVRAVLLLESGKPENMDAAIAGFQTLVDKRPTEEGIRYQLGRAYQAKGNIEAARVQFVQAAKRPTYLAPRLALAQLSLQSRHYDDALRYSKEILTYDTQNVPVRLLQASALRQSGKYVDARAELSRLLKEQPDNPDIQLELGLLELSQKRYREAEAMFLKLYKPGQPDVRALAGLVETYFAGDQKDKAIQVLTEELKKSPNSTVVRTALAEAAAATGHFALAIEQYQQILAAGGGNSAVHRRLGEAYQAMGKNAEAAASFGKASELAPKDILPILAMARLLETTGRVQESKVQYERAYALSPEDPAVLNNLAYSLAQTGAAAQALPLIQRALQKLPDNTHLSDTLGYVYLKQNMNDSAAQIFYQLTAKEPQNPTYRLHLAMALIGKGDMPKAKNELETALTHKPSKEQEGQIRDMLAKIG